MSSSLGEGGYGEVWLALHEKTKAKRVFKFCYEPDRVRGLKREVVLFRLLKESLGHRDDIAQIVDWQFSEPPYFLESEYTEGGDLKDWADAKGGIGGENVPIETRLELAAQVAVALGAAHSAGVLHKDIKPSNILISEVSGKDVPRASLTDFGIGLITDPAALAAQGITAAGFTETLVNSSTPTSGAGTRLYMAPEIVEGKPATTLSDIYSLGVVLYQLVTGDLSQAVATGWERNVDDDLLREDIAACVDGDPERRLKSANDLAERLRTLEARTETLRQVEETKRLSEMMEKKRRQFRMLGAAGMALTVIVCAVAFREYTLRGQAEEARAAAESAQRESDQLRIAAETARDHAEESRADAVAARALAETLRDDAEQKKYLADLRLAANFLDQDNVASARGVLVGSPPRLRHWEWGHLVNRAWPPESEQQEIRTFEAGTTAAERWRDSKPRLLTTLEGHKGLVKKAVFSPDETKVLSTSLDGSTRLWSLPDGTLIWSADSSGGPPTCAFGPLGNRVVFARASTGIVADAATGKTLVELDGHADPLTHVAFGSSGDVVFTASIDGTYRVWNPEDGKERSRYEMGDATNLVPSIVSIPDTTRVLLTESRNRVVEWDYAENRVVQEFQGPAPGRLEASLISGDRTLALSWERTVNAVSVWKLETGLEVSPLLLGPSLANFGATVSPDSSAVLFRTSTQALWADTVSFNPRLLGGAADLVIDGPGTISRSGSLIALPDAGDTVRVLAPVRRDSLSESVLTGHTNIVFHADFTKDSKKLYTSSFDGTAREWDLENGGESRVVAQHDAEIAVMRIHPNNRFLISFGFDNMGYVTDLNARDTAHSHRSQMPAYFAGTVRSPVFRLASAITKMEPFSPDGTKVVFPPTSKGVPVIDMATGAELFHLVGHHQKYVYLVQFSPDNRYIATLGYQENFVNLWDASDGSHLRRMEIDNIQIFFMRFGPEGKTVVTCDSIGDTTFWNVDDGEVVQRLRSRAGPAFHAGFSPDGRIASVSGADTNVRLWDWEKGEVVAMMRNHTSLVFGSHFSPDGNRLLTMANDNTARVWKLDGTQLDVLRHAEGVLLYYAEWSPDGKSIVTCASDNTAKIWRAVDWTKFAEGVDSISAFEAQLNANR